MLTEVWLQQCARFVFALDCDGILGECAFDVVYDLLECDFHGVTIVSLDSTLVSTMLSSEMSFDDCKWSIILVK